MPNKKVHALLIAIDSYQAPVPPLNGCINDSLMVQEYLENAVGKDSIELTRLHNEEATRMNIATAFLSIADKAGEDEHVFIHYSGHGSRENSPEIFWHIEPDRKNETLVCYDSRRVIDGVYHRDLADKELAFLIQKIAATGAHIVLVFDCCHSGSATKNVEQVTSRFTDGDQSKARSVEDYIFHDQELGGTWMEDSMQEGLLVIEPGNHVLMSGCRSDETSKELSINGKKHGIFTWALIDTLKRANGNISYRDLVRRANAYVTNKVSKQHPQLETHGETNLAFNKFLGDSANTERDHFVVAYDKTLGWNINAGSVHGLPTEQSGAIKLWLSNADDSSESKFEATITEVQPSHSILKWKGMDKVAKDQIFHGRLSEMEIPKMKVFLQAEDPENADQVNALSLVRTAIRKIGPDNTPSLLLELVQDIEEADYRVISYHHEMVEKFRICRLGDDRPIVKQTEDFDEFAANAIANQLQKIARWDQVLELGNPTTSIPSGAIQVKIVDQAGETKPQVNGEVVLQYEKAGNDWKKEGIRIQVKNNWDRKLFVCLLHMEENFAIDPQIMGGVWVGPGEDGFAANGIVIYPEIPRELFELGITEIHDRVKLIASTSEFDSSRLRQEGLPYASTMRSVDTKTVELSTRAFGFSQFGSGGTEQSIKAEDWTTDLAIIRTIRPLTNEGFFILEQAGLKIVSKGNLKTRYQLSSMEQSQRGLESSPVPVALANDLSSSEVVTFQAGRGSSPELNVLELSDIQNPEDLNEEYPVEIDLPVVTDEHSMVLPIATDGETFHILGTSEPTRDGKTRVTIERLPDPTASATRGLGSTVKILFHKIAADTLGWGYPYPYLAKVSVKDDSLLYEQDLDKVTDSVKEANRVLVIIHGFTGETKTFFQPSDKEPPNALWAEMKKHYDLVLAFDYESYNTPISRTAGDLKEKLEAVGLGDDHGKTLHLMVHSMGGLVSRYFIEKEGGNRTVNHLIMLGTPNAGSPWPKVKQWAAFAATLLINQIPVVGWPLSALTFLMDKAKWIDSLDKVTEDMQIGSDFLTSLEISKDPKVPYTLIAGNTSIKTDPHKPEKAESRVGKILEKIGIEEGPIHHKIVNLLFREANDIAVSVNSINSVNEKWDPAPRKIEVACDHMCYFSDERGHECIAEVLAELNKEPVA